MKLRLGFREPKSGRIPTRLPHSNVNREPRGRWPVPSVRRKLKPEERAILKPMESLCGEMNRLSAAIVRHARGRSPVPETLLSRMQKVADLLAKLSQYASSHLSSLPKGEATAALKAGVAILRKRGSFSKEEVSDVRKRALRRPRGRPETTRHLAARAEGLRRMNPKWTWQALADHLHPPGYPAHAQPFRQRLRRDVVRLRALLRKIDSFLQKQPADS